MLMVAFRPPALESCQQYAEMSVHAEDTYTLLGFLPSVEPEEEEDEVSISPLLDACSRTSLECCLDSSEVSAHPSATGQARGIERRRTGIVEVGLVAADDVSWVGHFGFGWIGKMSCWGDVLVVVVEAVHDVDDGLRREWRGFLYILHLSVHSDGLERSNGTSVSGWATACKHSPCSL